MCNLGFAQLIFSKNILNERMNPARQTNQRLFYGGLFATLAMLLWGWWAGSASTLATPGGRLIVLSRLFGLLATYVILLEVLLMSRTPFFERNFDLQEMIDLHRWNGYVVLGGITAHLAFVVLGYAAPGRMGLWHQFVQLNTQYEDVFKATLGTIVFIAATALSLQVARRYMSHELWLASHITLYGAILLTALHQLKTGGDLAGHFWFTAYWYMGFIGVFGLLAWHRFVLPVIHSWRYRFTVEAVTQEAQNVYSVYVSGKDLEQFRFEPGQYGTWWILAPGMWWQGHPFSFSAAPRANMLRFTVKAKGDFNSKVAALQPGRRIILDGPRGSFTADRAYGSDTVVLIAGGIGVTPYLATIQTLLNQGKSVTLLYAVRTKNDLAFGNELLTLQKQGLRIRLFINEQGQTIGEDILAAFARPNTALYICGPDSMSRELSSTLKRLGVSKRNIITERFAF